MAEEVTHLLILLSRQPERHPVDVELGGERRPKSREQGFRANSQGLSEDETQELAGGLRVAERLPCLGLLLESAKA